MNNKPGWIDNAIDEATDQAILCYAQLAIQAKDEGWPELGTYRFPRFGGVEYTALQHHERIIRIPSVVYVETKGDTLCAT